MDYRNLSAAQRRAYNATVRGSHSRRVELQWLTRDGRPIRSLPDSILSGQVDEDMGRTPAAILQVEVLDTEGLLNWEHGEHHHYAVRVVDSRFIPDLDEWVDCTVFTGPVWDFERSDHVVSLVAQSQERMAMGSVRTVFNRGRKARATAVIRDLLTAAGANKNQIRVPHQQATLPKRITVGVPVRNKDGKILKDREGDIRRRQTFQARDTYIAEAQRIAAAIDRLLYADPLGRFVKRPHPTRPVTALGTRHLLEPIIGKRGSSEDIKNTWEILGHDPKGAKRRVRVTVALPKSHPLSAQSLSWHGNPYELIERVENDKLKTRKQAREVGMRLRDRAVKELVSYEAQAIPCLPWLEPHQIVAVPTDGGRVQLRVTKRTLPLGTGADPMTLGANRRRGWR